MQLQRFLNLTSSRLSFDGQRGRTFLLAEDPTPQIRWRFLFHEATPLAGLPQQTATLVGIDGLPAPRDGVLCVVRAPIVACVAALLGRLDVITATAGRDGRVTGWVRYGPPTAGDLDPQGDEARYTLAHTSAREAS